jgi:hypothetical protein
MHILQIADELVIVRRKEAHLPRLLVLSPF